MLDAKQIIGVERTPTLDGERLGRHLLKLKVNGDRSGVQIDVRDLAPEDIVSSFVNAFLHTLQQSGWSDAELKKIRWVAQYDTERDRLKELAKLYFTAPSHGEKVAARHGSG
jgi:hypothetical protein